MEMGVSETTSNSVKNDAGHAARASKRQLLQALITLTISALVRSESITARSYVFACLIIAIVALSKRMPMYHQTKQ